MKITPFIVCMSLANIFRSASSFAHVYFGDFTGKKLNTRLWNVANWKWAENIKLGILGGVVPDNVFITVEV
ncbi:hypothetical protein LPB86_20055 [Pedobacter sp. MC2016-14]|uniref:hypothetical protein n=1 Tax=Pedobacter sp. MC2016-14 TaxID=2897327 RepID=UPI001E2BBA8D|nr:hypothetical protein [Pedobacter sp. MC2016-14]MCD0490544.1 hypothetical protein [Pedobacter sp. MC2016-14]